jgi:hypothetical protein
MIPSRQVRPSSPAEFALMPCMGVPGSPIRDAVANNVVMPNHCVRPPSPANVSVMPIAGLPGSPFAK